MTRRSRPGNPESLRAALVELLTNFRAELAHSDVRRKVLALVPAFQTLRDLGSSLIPAGGPEAARDRLLLYLTRYPKALIAGDELMVVAGISEWARRVRELRVQFGWSIASGTTLNEMATEGELSLAEIHGAERKPKPDDYALLSREQDKQAAYRWNTANAIRKRGAGVRAKLLEFLRANVGNPVTGEELRYVANDRTEWARRVRELRTEEGWPVLTCNTGRPELKIGTYLLEQDRQSPPHDRKIPDAVRGEVLRRDNYRCQDCGWTHDLWNRSDPRFLELHHDRPHVRGGANRVENLVTLCTVCHDRRHSGKLD